MSVENFTTNVLPYDIEFLTMNPENGDIYVPNKFDGSTFVFDYIHNTTGIVTQYNVTVTGADYAGEFNLVAYNSSTNPQIKGTYIMPLTSDYLYYLNFDGDVFTAQKITGPNSGSFQQARYFTFASSEQILIGKIDTNTIYVYTSNITGGYVETSFSLTITGDPTTTYRPLMFVFGRSDNELYVLCEKVDNGTVTDVRSVLLVTKPLTTPVISMITDGLDNTTRSIAYDSYNHKLFLSINSNGHQVVVGLDKTPLWDPTISGRPQLISDGINNMLFYEGDLYFPTTAKYIARASKTLFPVCLAEGTRVLTPNGYLPVEQLKKYDYITTADGRNITIKHVHHSQHFDAGEMEAPFLVPANALSEGVPLHDVKLSPDHLVLIGEDCWLSPRHMAKRSDKVVQYSLGETIQYYAIMTGNYFQDNLVIEDGVVVESYGYRRTVYDETVKAFRRVPEKEV